MAGRMPQPAILQSPRQRKSTGAYYTPAALIELLLDYALPPLLESSDQPLKILDPACGAGDFLRAVFKRLGHLRKDDLFGVDIDPVGANRCKTCLLSDGIATDHLHIHTG